MSWYVYCVHLQQQLAGINEEITLAMKQIKIIFILWWQHFLKVSDTKHRKHFVHVNTQTYTQIRMHTHTQTHTHIWVHNVHSRQTHIQTDNGLLWRLHVVWLHIDWADANARRRQVVGWHGVGAVAGSWQGVYTHLQGLNLCTHHTQNVVVNIFAAPKTTLSAVMYHIINTTITVIHSSVSFSNHHPSPILLSQIKRLYSSHAVLWNTCEALHW